MLLRSYLRTISVYAFQNLVVNCVGLKYTIVKKDLPVCKTRHKITFKSLKKHCDHKESNSHKYDVNPHEMHL